MDNVSVTTYALDAGTLEPSIVGGSVGLLPTSSFMLQLVPSPDDHFLYVLWSDTQQQEHLSAYATDRSGVPQIPPVQILDVSSLSQLNMHPSGKFAYAMELDNSTGAYISTILLFHVTASGILQLDANVQGRYGPAPFPTFLYGVSPDGTQIYLTSEDAKGPLYWESALNGQNGTLAPNDLLFRPPIRDSVVLGATLVVDYQNALNYSPPGYVNVLLNEPEPPQQLIHCASTMLGACGTATNVQLDPSGQYLFLTDPASQQVHVAGIDLSANVITDTGNFLPFTAETPGFAFSPDGILVYAWLASDSSLHIYGFDQTSGNLTEGAASIPLPNSAGFSPALRR
ncbi:MAG: hypothetical protein WA830_00630 [Candidatus Sulfotelmatobacter sp.]